MRLKDSDKIDYYLGEWAEEFYKKAENADADFMDGYCMTINKIQSSKVPIVDAIPIEWIESQVDKGKWAELVQRWAERRKE